MPNPLDPSEELLAELERVRVTLSTAGYATGVATTEIDGEVWIRGTPRDTPRRSWRGTEQHAFELLAGIETGAGVDAFWERFAG